MSKLLYLLFIFFPAGLFAQATISGRVVNQADHKPVPDASVFLNNSSVGVKTANNGTFYLKNVKPGKYELIISVIGFEKYDQTVIVNNGDITLADIFLAPETIQLNEVSIKSAPDNNRQKYYAWFKDEFLGTSGLADECKIVNPEILRLRYDKKNNILTASSPDFLIVENDALGYKIKYLLSGFILDKSPLAKFHLNYQGSVLFEELHSTPSREKRWQKRRLEVYNGSLMQFLRCSLNNTFEQAGFRVYHIDNQPNPKRPPDSLVTSKVKAYQSLALKSTRFDDSLNYWVAKAALPEYIQNLNKTPLTQTDFITLTDQKGLFALTGKNGSLLVVNKSHHAFDDAESLDITITGYSGKTIINFTNGPSLFDKNGSLADPASLFFDGVWGNYRVAELLPVDYDPSQNELTDTEKQETDVAENEISDDPVNLKTSLLALKAKSDSVAVKLIPEKLYLQFDKPYYAVGDTIWFKAYVLNNFLTPSDKSAIVNIEIATDSGKVVGRYRLPVQTGLAWGNIILDDKYFAAGTYTLRAYTNWMRNFGDESFFYKTINISSAGAGQLLVNAAFGNSTLNGSPSVEAKLRFTDMTGLPLASRSLTMQLIDGNKHLGTQKYLTGVDGVVDLNFTMPQKAVNLSLVALNDKKDRLAVMPVPVSRPQDADIQFLPEGGSMVVGLPAHIGFKAIGEDGRGIAVSGIITDRAQKQVAAFRSLHNGMGSFALDIKDGESYVAQITLPGGTIKQYTLPPAKSSGTILSIKNEIKSDSLYLTLAASATIAASGQRFFLIGRARGIVCYAAIVNFHEGNSVSKRIAKALFPTGIAHFTLMTAAYLPVNERLVFIDHSDKLNIKLNTDKPYYSKRDSIALKLKVTDGDGDPVSGNFSMAVTEDAQVKLDSLNEENIATRFLLSADLKGYIEQPGYYLSAKTPETWQALDNLLLTQGWIGYDWAQVFNHQPIVYQPEREFAVIGHVHNVINKPVAGTSVLLFSKSPAILMDTVTDKEGKFVFDRLPRVDTPIFVLKAVNKSGKSFNVGINVDEIASPVFAKPAAPLNMPWFVNIDSTLFTYTKNALQLNQQRDFTASGHVLKEVNIKAKKIIKDSQNLNGSGNADFVMDEKDLEAAGKKTWLQLLQENIKGFKEGEFDVMGGDLQKVRRNWMLNLYVTDRKLRGPSREWYFVNRQPVKLIVDGISVTQILETGDFIDLKGYLSHSAEDIKGIEMISSAKYTAEYLKRYDPGVIVEALLGDPSVSIAPSDVAFIEITTRSGNGPGIVNTPGMYLYKPLPISWPKAFYKPKYTVKDTAQNHRDLRSTIDWEPNIITDAKGEATLWFYTADKPSTYTITIEGTDMKGHLGYKSEKISVNTNKEKSR